MSCSVTVYSSAPSHVCKGQVWLAANEGMSYWCALAYGLTGCCVLPAAVGALYAGPGNFVERHVRLAGQSFGGWIKQTVANPFREFLSRDGALLILLFVLVYKVGDAMGQGMLNPMIVELGFTDTEFITVNKLGWLSRVLLGVKEAA